MNRRPDTSVREERFGGLGENLGQKLKPTGSDVTVSEQIAVAVMLIGRLGSHDWHAYYNS